ncbi:MAG: hypothetical protein ACYDDC_05850 [Thermoplasmataceae archaeon]
MTTTNGSESTALAVASPGAIISTTEMRAALQAAKEQQDILGLFVRDIMTEGVDYGMIPGTARKGPDGKEVPNSRTLLKPGAEKLISFFRCRPRFKLRRTEDPDKGLYAYEFRCEILTASGDVVAEGFGSASSRESKYRWRTAQRKCPKCQQPAIGVSKFADRNGGNFGVGSYYCNKKQGGCGSQFEAGDKAIEGQQLGRTENPDVADVANTVLKMAKKRAMVDAALALARCSDLFGQDLEDLVDATAPAPTPKSQVAAPTAKTAPAKTSDGEPFDPNTGELGDPGQPLPEELAADISDKIGQAQTLADLNALAPRVTKLPDALKPALRHAFAARMGWIAAQSRQPGEEG